MTFDHVRATFLLLCFVSLRIVKIKFWSSKIFQIFSQRLVQAIYDVNVTDVNSNVNFILFSHTNPKNNLAV